MKFGVRPQWIPNGVDTGVFRPIKKEKGKIAFVGKLEKWKGAEMLPSVARKISEKNDIQLHVVGDGSLLRILKKKCRDLPVVFHNRLPHRNIPDIIGSSELLLHPSFIEGLPTVCLESLACETPVIATDVGGTSETVIDGVTGSLIQPNDTPQIHLKIQEFLNDEGKRKTFGKNGRMLVQKYYGWDEIVARVNNACKEVLAST